MRRPVHSTRFFLLLSATENYSSQASNTIKWIPSFPETTSSAGFWQRGLPTVAPSPLLRFATLPRYRRLPLGFLQVSNLGESSDPI